MTRVTFESVLTVATLVVVFVAWVLWINASPSAQVSLTPKADSPAFTVQRSGGNCVYMLKGKYVDQLEVVPIGPEGC